MAGKAKGQLPTFLLILQRRDWRTDGRTQTGIDRHGLTDTDCQTDIMQRTVVWVGGEHPRRQCVKHNGSAPPEDPVWSLNPSCSFSSANTCFLIEGRLLNVGSRWLRSESIPRFGSQLVARLRASARLTDLGYSWSLTPQLRLLARLLRRSCQAPSARQHSAQPPKIMRTPEKETMVASPCLQLTLRPKQVLGTLAMSLTPLGGCWTTAGGCWRPTTVVAICAPGPSTLAELLVGKPATSNLIHLCNISSSTQPI